MPFIPHTEDDIDVMLAAIGIPSLEQLFDEIPPALRCDGDLAVPPGMNEAELIRFMKTRAARNTNGVCFIGAGAYEHHIPQAVFDLASRGEYLTAYTPYQAEASQGALQLIYEYQTMIASLLGMEVSNASLYDGATALAESILMAVRCHRHKGRPQILIPSHLHPFYLETIQTIVGQQGIDLVTVPVDPETGLLTLAAVQSVATPGFVAMVISQPNFFGLVETVDAITDWVHAEGGLVIACVNPMAMALFKEPGAWGQTGADIACGEGQPLGVALSSGGAYFGFMATRLAYVRQMPGRLVGRTVDTLGKPGFTLTLQAREQHIRRAKATSNICTNQGLLVVFATIYMSIMGYEGLRQTATASHGQLQYLLSCLTAIPGVKQRYQGTPYCEAVIDLPVPAMPVLSALAKQGIQGGFALSPYFPDSECAVLVCATEMRTDAECEQYAAVLASLLAGGVDVNL